MNTKEELFEAKKRVEALEQQLCAEEDAATQARQKPLRALAARAHALLCQYNHTDGCGWGYEGEDGDAIWSQQNRYGAHARWLKSTENVLKECHLTLEQLDELLTALDTVRLVQPQWFRIITLLRGY